MNLHCTNKRWNSYRYFFCIQLVLLFAANVHLRAQNKYLDSLKQELNNPHTDSVRISLSQEIGYNYLLDSPEIAKQYFYNAYQLCRKNNYRDAEGTSLAYLAMSFENKDDLDSASFYLAKALDVFKNDTSVRARTNYGSLLNEMANIEKAQGKPESAIQHYLESMDYTPTHETKEKYLNIAIGYYNVALVFEEMKEYRNAVSYCKKAILAGENGLQKNTDTAYLGIIHSRMSLMKMSLIHNLLELDEKQKALKLLQNEEAEVGRLNNNNLSAFFYTEWGNYYAKMNQNEKAITSFEKALDFAWNIGQRKILALKALGDVYKKEGDYVSSVAAYRQILDTKQARNKLKIQAEAIRDIADVLLMDKQYKESALAFSQFNILSDSLNELETKKQINETENKYQVKQKQDSILVLQKNNQIQSLALQKRRTLNYVLITGIAMLVLIGVLIYRNLKHRHLILKQNEILHQQRIQELENEHRLVAAQSLMKGQEEERSRLAKDLHDSVGGLLSGVKLSLSNMKGNVFLSEENAMAVNKIINQLDGSITELRRVSHNMMPEALIKFGLKEALENYCENINQSGSLSVQLQTYGLNDRMEQDSEIVIYRMIQEMLNNIIKHAAASHVLVQLIKEADKLTITVEDDGKGFDRKSPFFKEGAGLKNIEARASYLNGSVDMQSKPGEGTSITVEAKIS